MDTGKSGLRVTSPVFKAESQKLIKYFLAALTIKEDDLWVNLSPYEKERVVPQELGKTGLGRDMLVQDYILKQVTASLIYPEKQLGRVFWDEVYAKAWKKFGTTNIPVNTFNKVWIVADKAKVFEHNNAAYVVAAHLKVMLEEDYLSLQKHSGFSPSLVKEGVRGSSKINKTHSLTSRIVRSVLLPRLEREVNEGRNFAPLRQIFYSMILASWYKLALKDALLNQVYSNKGKTSGVLSEDPKVKEKIYDQYLKAYKEGVFNYIKEDLEKPSLQKTPRKYFSGGVRLLQRPPVVEQALSSPSERFAMDPEGSLAMVSVMTHARVNAAMNSVIQGIYTKLDELQLNLNNLWKFTKSANEELPPLLRGKGQGNVYIKNCQATMDKLALGLYNLGDDRILARFPNINQIEKSRHVQTVEYSRKGRIRLTLRRAQAVVLDFPDSLPEGMSFWFQLMKTLGWEILTDEQVVLLVAGFYGYNIRSLPFQNVSDDEFGPRKFMEPSDEEFQEPLPQEDFIHSPRSRSRASTPGQITPAESQRRTGILQEIGEKNINVEGESTAAGVVMLVALSIEEELRQIQQQVLEQQAPAGKVVQFRRARIVVPQPADLQRQEQALWDQIEVLTPLMVRLNHQTLLLKDFEVLKRIDRKRASDNTQDWQWHDNKAKIRATPVVRLEITSHDQVLVIANPWGTPQDPSLRYNEERIERRCIDFSGDHWPQEYLWLRRLSQHLSVIERGKLIAALEGFSVMNSTTQEISEEQFKGFQDNINNAKRADGRQDFAMPGGIALNARNMGLDVQGHGVAMIFNPAMMAQFRKGDFTGIEGVILQIALLASSLPIFGL
ncbi:MAG: hypothetical protein HQL13_05270 [Candidatus Omnitrophica bacterium]|nr:hypothetical protein [Candidatus Omnitrophota bacterium]